MSAFSSYRRLTSSFVPDYIARPALSNHDDLLWIMNQIREHPSESKAQLMEDCFGPNGQQMANSPTAADQERVLNLAASVLLSMNCGIPGVCIDRIDDGDSSLPWTLAMSIEAFILEAFVPAPVTPGQGQVRAVDQVDLKALTAKQLKHKAGLRFERTDDLFSHLRLDPKTRTVHVFDCTAALEEMLQASVLDSTWCLLPRGLLIEVLYTIYKILFPPGREAQTMLVSLTREAGFDKDMLRYTTQLFRRDDDPEVDYSYFGHRLIELHNELKDPSPRNWFERLFEGGTKSAERKMLMATAIGVFIAVTIGLFGLVIAGFQAWVGYQQWKHPIKNE